MRPAEQQWGLGEVALGFLMAQALAVVATVIAMGAAGWEVSADIPLWAGALLQVPLWAGYLGAVVLAGAKGGGIVGDFGLSVRGRDVPIGLLVGVVVQLVVLPIVYLPILRLSGYTDDDLSAPARALSDKASGPVGWILLTLIVVVGAPIVEELFFRGLLLRSLQKRGLPDWASIVLCAAIFGAVHFQLLQFVGLFVIGLVLSYMAVRTGRLGLSIFTHVGFNATSVVLLYLTS
jgi:membrane protease YdiL (CAAX protease family)